MKEVKTGNLREEVIKAKDFHKRNFSQLTDNFYVVKAALRYYSVKQGLSITSSRMAGDFPITIPAAGSCLSILEEIGVLQQRTDSSSKSRYLPENVDMEKLQRLEEILVESHEIEPFES